MITSIFIKTKTQLLVLGFVLFFFNTAFSQTNLVPNYSFEEFTDCPFNISIYQKLNIKPNVWFKPDNRYASYINACSNDSIYGGVPNHLLAGGKGYQPARTGNAYIAMFHFGSVLHYFEVKLYDSLKANKKYYGECYVNLANPNVVACNSQSMFFSKQAVYVDTAHYDTLLRNPQVYNFDNPIITDTLNWVKVSGVFTAQGGEQYLTLGNFRNYFTETKRIKFQNTGMGSAYYYYDDIAVYNLDSFCLKADAGKDTTINAGDTVYIGSYTNGIDSLRWLQNSIVIDTLKPGFLVHPTTTTSYILQQTVNGCFSSDTVTVTVKPLPLKMMSYELRMMNESLRGTKQSIENIWQTANEINVSHFNIQRSINGNNFITIGKVTAQNKITNEYTFYDSPPVEGLGVVYYRIESIDFDGRKQYSETRTLNLKPQTLNGVSIYPNPAKDIINIASQENIKEVKIINNLGQIIYSNSINSSSYIINLESFPKGLYILKISTSKKKTKTQKIIIQ